MSIDVLAPSETAEAPPARSVLRLALSGLVVVLVLALVAGVTLAVRGLSGGGSQPEDALPGGAFAFAKVDLDPPAGQKLDALRFLRQFPALEDEVGLDSDLRETLFEQVAEEAGWADLDFDRDVAPWLGQRIGVAAYAPASEPADGGPGSDLDLAVPPVPTVVVAVQVTDAEAARTGLRRLVDAASGPRPGMVVQDGYALLAEDQPSAERAARDARRSVLAEDRDLRADFAALGDGIAAAWVDASAAGALTGVAGLSTGMLGVGPVAGAGVTGRTAYVVRFDGPDALEIRGAVTGADPVLTRNRSVRGFEDLPADSVAAVGLTGGDDVVRRVFASAADGGALDSLVAGVGEELGLELPDDLAVLLGTNLVAAVGPLHDGTADVGARVTTDGARATEVLDRLAAAAERAGEGLPVVHRRTDDGYVLGSTPEGLDRMLDGGGLGDRSEVRAALPDLDGAAAAVFVDVRALFEGWSDDGEIDANLDRIAGVGLTVQAGDGGDADYRLRLVTR